MKASDLFVQCLEAESVEYVFGLPGEENLDLLESLRNSSIHFVSARDERGAAFMADVYGRLSGKSGVCLSTLGPGALNLMTGIASANLDHSPVVAITGQGGLNRVHKESHQYVDIVRAFQPIVKWNTRLEQASVISEVIRKAFKEAQGEKPGVSHIEVPEDINTMLTEEHPIPATHVRRPSPDRKALADAARFIDEAEHPILLVGNGAIRGNAGKEILEFSKKTRIPLVNTFMGKGIVPWDYELSLLTIGLQSQDYLACGFDQTDLIITVGYDLVEYAPRHWNPKKKPIINIDFTPSEVDAFFRPSIEIVADIRETLELLTQEVHGQKNSEHWKRLRSSILHEFSVNAHHNGVPLKPQRILHDVRQVMGHDDILISDVGAHKVWIARMFPAYQPNTVVISNGLSPMGIALPGALAAKIIYPEKRILAICGDGGFTMTCAELETACRLNLSFVVLIMNDNGYGLISWKQQKKFQQTFATNLGPVDFSLIAKAYGARGFRINAAEELTAVLEHAFSLSVPSVIEVPVDYSENFRFMEEWGNFVCNS